MHIIRIMKHQIASISLLAAMLSGQASIDAPTDAYQCESTLTVNGIIAYTGSSLGIEPNAHLISSILEASVTNGFGVGNHDSSDGTNAGSTSNYAGYGFTGVMK